MVLTARSVRVRASERRAGLAEASVTAKRDTARMLIARLIRLATRLARSWQRGRGRPPEPMSVPASHHDLLAAADTALPVTLRADAAPPAIAR
jgi:hypothetical protein